MLTAYPFLKELGMAVICTGAADVSYIISGHIQNLNEKQSTL